jgi:hypothetical protein
MMAMSQKAEVNQLRSYDIRWPMHRERDYDAPHVMPHPPRLGTSGVVNA